MSSIHRQPGKPFFFCAYTEPDVFRRRRFRSTGTTNHRIASTIASTIERAASLVRQEKLANEKAMRLVRHAADTIAETHGKVAADAAERVLRPIIEEFVQMAGGELTNYSTRVWLESWLAAKTEASISTRLEYRRATDLLIEFLGSRADRPISALQPLHIEQFKARLARRIAASTVNKTLKILKTAFASAVAKRQLEFNPAEHVELMEVKVSQRRAFNLEEIRQLLTVADNEWRTMILLGIYTGQRLQDCASLTWREVDLLQKVITLRTQKTDRAQVIPIAEPLAKHLEALAGDDPDAPLCPVLRGKPSSRLSAQFHRIMVKAGLAAPRPHVSKGAGRDAQRETSTVSFHSLRHSATSLLKSAGVSDSVAMDIIGHDTAAVSRTYTHIADDAKRAAVNKLPDVTA